MIKSLAWIIATLAIIGCDDVVDPLAHARLQTVSGFGQVGGTGAELTDLVVVKLSDGNGAPLANEIVNWNVVEGGGSVDSVITHTNVQGNASVRWELGTDPGPQTLVASTRTASTAIRAVATERFESVSGGFLHTCALSSSGQPYCWGNNGNGQTGSAQLAASSLPTAVPGHLHLVAISAGWTHTCGLTTAGEVFCWGENIVGQLGSPGPQSATPRLVSLNVKASVVSAGYQHTCAVTINGAVYCWGNDDRGQLGSGGSIQACLATVASKCTATPQKVAGATLFKDVTAGEYHTCAVALDGSLFCWGWNSDGQTGTSSPGGATIVLPTRAASSRFYRRAGSGARHACAITTANEIECWGRNGAGENGLDPITSLTSPAPLPTALRFSKVDGGNTHTCGLTVDQRAYCWGSELGNGTGNASRVPTAVSNLGVVTDVDGGWQHACAVMNGAVWCWGSNSNGQLGQSAITRSNTPLMVQMARP